MKKKHKNIIKIILFISIGIGLFYLVYKDFDIETILTEIKNVNYWWFVPMFVFSILSHISRTVRWQMLLNSDGSKVRFTNTFMAVLNGYFANIALPRLGEVTRCAIVSKYEKQNFSKVLGTMVSERITDVIMLALVTILAFLLQSTQISQFIANNPNLGIQLEKLISLPIIIAFIIVGGIGIIFLVNLLKGKLDHIAIFKKLSDFIKSFWKGILSIKKVKSPFWYFVHSVFIWSMYFFTLYICFFAFEGFAELGIITALIVFVAGSFGMVAPAPNGIGAYHFMIIQAFILYGIANEKAAAFALIVHGFQTFIIVIAGLVSFILLPIINKE